MANVAIRPVRVEGQVAYVELTKGYTAIIDASDADIAGQFNWFAQVTPHTVYAARKSRGEKKIFLHRLLIEVEAGVDVDHISGDGLDNRKSNLRCADRCENNRNSAMRKHNACGVKGVRWQAGKWRARIRVKNVEIDLGRHSRIEDARDAYAKASAQFHGEFGCVTR